MGDLAPFFGGLTQNEKLSENMSPFGAAAAATRKPIELIHSN
jgi:hypothetical protein